MAETIITPSTMFKTVTMAYNLYPNRSFVIWDNLSKSLISHTSNYRSLKKMEAIIFTNNGTEIIDTTGFSDKTYVEKIVKILFEYIDRADDKFLIPKSLADFPEEDLTYYNETYLNYKLNPNDMIRHIFKCNDIPYDEETKEYYNFYLILKNENYIVSSSSLDEGHVFIRFRYNIETNELKSNLRSLSQKFLTELTNKIKREEAIPTTHKQLIDWLKTADYSSLTSI